MDKLVSILVISYNSVDFVTQTLESIYNQTYSNIELVISDDGSNDNSMSIIEEWLDGKVARFSSVIVQTSSSNQGIPKNINKGIKVCKGFYIKIIAADDILDSMCIENNIKICEVYQYRIVFSNMKVFFDNDTDKYEIWDYFANKYFFNLDSRMQNKMLSAKNVPYAPTSFIERKLLEEVDFFDESYLYMEDYPMWYKITKSGVKLNYFDVNTVFYRIHGNSLSNGSSKRLVSNRKFYSSDRLFFYKTRCIELIKNQYFYDAYTSLIKYSYYDIILIFGNQLNPLTRMLGIILFLDPKHARNWFKKVFKGS